MTEKTLSAHKEYSRGEEWANSISHGVGLLLAVAALTLLIVFAALNGTARHVVSFSIYGTTFVILYLASTLYHSFQHPDAKRVLRVFDHVAIYLLIAGTYTPFTLITLGGAIGWTLFGISWGLAACGIVFKCIFTGRFEKLSLVIYLIMGWLVLIGLKPLFQNLSHAGLFWLILGGAFYTGGILFYTTKRIPWNHAIWHLFVLAGSVSHFFAILFHALPWDQS